MLTTTVNVKHPSSFLETSSNLNIQVLKSGILYIGKKLTLQNFQHYIKELSFEKLRSSLKEVGEIGCWPVSSL